MKTIIRLLVVFALALTTFMQHSTASAATVIRSEGYMVHAHFNSFDHCTETNVTIFAGEFIGPASPGNPSPVSWLFVDIETEDFCGEEEELVLFAQGTVLLSDKDFKISNSLKSATVHGTVPVRDLISGRTFVVLVDLTWTGFGPLDRHRSSDHLNTPGCKISNKFVDASRLANASGVVSDGTTNFAPDPSRFAWLLLETRREAVIGCN